MAHLRRWFERIAGSLVGLLGLLLLAGFTYEQMGRARDVSRLPPRMGQSIDIGGRTLNLYCSGEGSPTVILETGGNGPGYEWTSVQTKLANFTRACWYDRAGVGWSDPPQSPRTSATVVSDLHEMLGRAVVPPPYVLVGASIGGEYARIYTNSYPHDVAGLVFVDSSHPDQQEPPFMLSPFNRVSPRARELICTALPFMARFGILRFMASRMGGPVPSQFSPEREILAKLNAQPKALRTDAEQVCAATDGGSLIPTLGTGNPELDNAARNAGSLGDLPLIVLTAGRYWAPPGLERQAADYHEIWVHQLQASLARLSTRGRQIVVDAPHDMDGAPDAVLTAVRQVIDEVRDKK
jgi:pimeloyl-ACP methyl ester carboxylesterase